MASGRNGALPLKSLNHISLLCSCLEQSVHFYQNILGFLPIRRPSSFNFDGAWLFNYGFSIHLLQREEHANGRPAKSEINTEDSHISFQCEKLDVVEKKVKDMGINYISRRVESGLYVDELFFQDPDGFLIKVCSFENLPILVPHAVSQPASDVQMPAGQLPTHAAAAEPAAATAAKDHNGAIVLYSC